MQREVLQKILKDNKEYSLYHRYITNEHIIPLLNDFRSEYDVKIIGNSVNLEPINSITVGHGPKKILIWSQMHGNESTTTKALFDILNVFKSKNKIVDTIITNCTLKIIPILNPDGARLYTRLNANKIDLNRDAQEISQPETLVLINTFNDFKPDFCYNLHGQRTIFSAGTANKSAAISFSAPAQNYEKEITRNRRQAMEIIIKMNEVLQNLISNQIGIYDDSFNLNCIGDTFQSNNTPTILIEAGHLKNDYSRENVRGLLSFALIHSLIFIANNTVTGNSYLDYLNIPKNKKLFFDVIIRRAKINENSKELDIGIRYNEVLKRGKVQFIPKVERLQDLSSFFGHFEINVEGSLVLGLNNECLVEGYENDFVLINNEIFALKSTKI